MSSPIISPKINSVKGGRIFEKMKKAPAKDESLTGADYGKIRYTNKSEIANLNQLVHS